MKTRNLLLLYIFALSRTHTQNTLYDLYFLIPSSIHQPGYYQSRLLQYLIPTALILRLLVVICVHGPTNAIPQGRVLGEVMLRRNTTLA